MCLANSYPSGAKCYPPSTVRSHVLAISTNYYSHQFSPPAPHCPWPIPPTEFASQRSLSHKFQSTSTSSVLIQESLQSSSSYNQAPPEFSYYDPPPSLTSPPSQSVTSSGPWTLFLDSVSHFDRVWFVLSIWVAHSYTCWFPHVANLFCLVVPSPSLGGCSQSKFTQTTDPSPFQYSY